MKFLKINDHAEKAALRNFYEVNDLKKINEKSDIFTSNGILNADSSCLTVSDSGHLSGLCVDYGTLEYSSDNKPKSLDLRPLADLIYLKNLEFCMNNMICEDLSPLAALTKLRYLKLRGISFSDLKPLAKLPKLKELEIGYNNLHDLSALADLKFLRSLEVTQTDIRDLTPLAQLTGLRRLKLTFNQITDLTPLARLPHLRRLNLVGNHIQNVEALTNLNSLTSLALDFNPISDPSSLAKLANLKSLTLKATAIKDLRLLEGLKSILRCVYWRNAPEMDGGECYFCSIKPQNPTFKCISGYNVSKFKEFDFYVYPTWTRPPVISFQKAEEKYFCYIVRDINTFFGNKLPSKELEKEMQAWIKKNRRNLVSCIGAMAFRIIPSVFDETDKFESSEQFGRIVAPGD